VKVFVLTSAAIHIAAFFLMASLYSVKPAAMDAKPFYATLAYAQKSRSADRAEADMVINSFTHVNETKIDIPKEALREVSIADIAAINKADLSPTLENFYSPTDVELVALPTSNLDSSMFGDLFISGLPIKLRLYINAFGHVVSIDRNDVLEQDLQMVERLEELLRQITFLPAKRNGASVDSYQDVEFSF
jgi:hypothetical protein